MKTLLFYSLFGISAVGLSQNDNPANYFYAQILGESVVLNFELRQGAVCFGIQIERRDSSSNFEQIGVISGICGSENSPESYVFSDNQPLKNRRSFYRLVFNGIGQSNELEVFMPDFETDDYVVALEPNTQQLAIFFRNPLEQNIQLNMYSLSGKLLYEASTLQSFITLPKATWQEKIVVFFIFSDDRKFYISGKVSLP